MNKFQFIGNLTRDVEIKYIASGEKDNIVGYFDLAVNNIFKKDKVDFFRITVWNKKAENCKKYLKKGSKCFVEGYIETTNYKDKDNRVIYNTSYIATVVEFLKKAKRIRQILQRLKDGEEINDEDKEYLKDNADIVKRIEVWDEITNTYGINIPEVTQKEENSSEEGSTSGANQEDEEDFWDTATDFLSKMFQPDKNFPLKLGSKGLKVKELQQALIRIHGTGALPKHKDDGQFGQETMNALQKYYNAKIVSQKLFNEILSKSIVNKINESAESKKNNVEQWIDQLNSEFNSFWIVSPEFFRRLNKTNNTLFIKIIKGYDEKYNKTVLSEIDKLTFCTPRVMTIKNRIKKLNI